MLVVEEVTTMRKSLLFFALLLVGCGDSDQPLVAADDRPPTQHVPEITQLTMSPGAAMHMEGAGEIIVSAEVTFVDAGSDLRNLWVKASDDLMEYFDEALGTGTGTFTEEFALSTEHIGIYDVEFWLVDAAGNASNRVSMEFIVGPDPEESDWTNRLSGSAALRDVTWDGTVFIVVGDDGTILTSPDGIDWVARDSGIDNGLEAIAAYGQDIFAVGGSDALLSIDHGENWITKNIPDGLDLSAVTVNATKVVAAGHQEDLGPMIILSEDRGDTWHVVDTFPAEAIMFTDLTYRGDLLIATTDSPFGMDGGRVLVSLDGLEWNEVFHDEWAGLATVVQAGDQLIVGGFESTVHASLDGLNWTDKQTPDVSADYLSSAWNGSEIVLAGSYSRWTWFHGGLPEHYVPVGVSSTDGGATWEAFYIDGYYISFGLAWGNERFVSVGWQPSLDDGVGAIYTAE
jgi:hypothetical protein